MKIVTLSNGKKSIRIAKSEWIAIGQAAGWKGMYSFNHDEIVFQIECIKKILDYLSSKLGVPVIEQDNPRSGGVRKEYGPKNSIVIWHSQFYISKNEQDQMKTFLEVERQQGEDIATYQIDIDLNNLDQSLEQAMSKINTIIADGTKQAAANLKKTAQFDGQELKTVTTRVRDLFNQLGAYLGAEVKVTHYLLDLSIELHDDSDPLGENYTQISHNRDSIQRSDEHEYTTQVSIEKYYESELSDQIGHKTLRVSVNLDDITNAFNQVRAALERLKR